MDSAAHDDDILQRVQEAATGSRSYFILLTLSTLIAAFGLISNSTATVIGAMIIAPLMGPILGIALALVRGEVRNFERSLAAEAQGVVACLAASALIAWVVGVANIDYGQSEIAARTRPTLFDMGIGFAAGLAGAYATIRPKISGSIAGVAIAVGLVPPLAVCGLTMSAALQGHIPWKAAGSAFMLFLANFVTIELAAALVFLLAGAGRLGSGLRTRLVGGGFVSTLTVLPHGCSPPHTERAGVDPGRSLLS